MAAGFAYCDLGSACSEQDFENFIDGAVALLDYSNTDCSLYDKVCTEESVTLVQDF